ncbi:ligand-binding sensor domain-containing protein [Luteimonas gilva]|uniref:ligand-binding sensor domain-containing protein n=1 Tax=Luteimonas gilva TaxID=2572684 RepID=UPI0016752A81|nr:two-component regulator propeller domain-containing protein [Luteimonas gilva]
MRVFTDEDGLPPSGVNAVVQSRDGYLWIGTFGGLARFDGLSFTVFKGQSALRLSDPEGGQYAGPASDRILALYEDDAGRLWIGTQDAGLSVFERGSFRHLSVCGGVCLVNDILQGPDKALWVATNRGLLKMDPASQRAVWIQRVEGSGYSRLASDKQGRIYVGGYGGLWVVVGQKLESISLPDAQTSTVLLKRSDDELLVGTLRDLYRYDPVRRQWRALGIGRPAYAARSADGQWWISLESGQVLRQDGMGAWRDVPELAVGTTSLTWDDEGNLWVGSGSKGLLRVRKPLFGLLAAPHLQANVAGRAVISDGLGGLWFGSDCGPLLHRRHDGTIQKLPLEPALENDCVNSLLLDRQGVLWVGTSGGVLGRIADDEPRQIAAWPNGTSVHMQDDQGRYLVSSGDSTFELETDAEGRIVARRRIDALGGMNINSVVAAANGGRWFVGDRGVFRLVGAKVVEQWTTREGLSSRFARALYRDDKTGTLWVGTYGGGLNRIRDGKVQRYDSHNGLIDDTVSCILADDRGRLWLAGNRGVALLPAPQEAAVGIESIGYSASDGLVPAEINGGVPFACHRDAQGRFWFSLVEGFAVIDPADVPQVRAVSLRPHIEHVSVAGRAQDAVGSTLTLKSFARNLEIRYTAINLTRPQETRFRFRLSGFDQDWVEAGQNRSILYPSIPWGEHLFEVQARTEGGPWSAVSAKLRILHPQPWYQRPWLWMLATSLGLLVLVGGTRLEKSRSSSESEQPSAVRAAARQKRFGIRKPPN